MLSRELEKIAGNEVQTYLFEQPETDIPNLHLHHQEMFGLPFRLIAEQLSARRKASNKLPLFYRTKGILYPPSINVEQCSSETTGNFKAEMVTLAIGKSRFPVADLTGGFGVDSFFLSHKATWVDYVEPDQGLLEIARHNHDLLGCTNIQYHETNAKEFLRDCRKKYELIYLDPSRRGPDSRKVFRLADCEPAINDLFPQLFDFTEFILIKTSPLLDIQQGLHALTAVKKVIVVSVNNECKELLFLIQHGFSGEAVIETYNLDKLGDAKQFFSFTFNEEKNTESDFSEPQTYLYEPNSSILKAGAFKMVGKKFALQKLQVSTHFYTSIHFKENFPGRIFRIDQLGLDLKKCAEKKANVITRNYPLTAEQLKKKLRITDGGEKYVIGFSSLKKKQVVLATRLA